MTNDEILAFMQRVISRISMNPSVLWGLDDHLLEQGIFDSLGFVQFFIELKRTYGIAVPRTAEDVAHLTSVRQIMNHITEHANAGDP